MSNHHKGRRTTAPSMERDAELRRRLAEAEQTLEAIRHGEVDGLVVAGPCGEQVYSLAGAEHVYRVIVETMHEAALTVDPDGTILFCNRRFCELMKTSIQAAMGNKVTAFAAPAQQFSLRKLLIETRLGPVQRRLLLRAADGTPVPVQLAASTLETGDRHSICLVASDLTELEASAHSVRILREQQQALEESEARLALELAVTRRLQEISTQLVHEEDAKALYDKILDAAVAIMRSDFASLQMFHPERGPGGELHLLGHRGFTPEAARFWEWVRPTAESTCGIALRTGQRVVTPDVQTLEFTPGSADRKTFLRTGIRAVQTTPLISRSGRLVGMISTHWRRPHQPTERDLRALDVLARQAADLIEHRQAQEALRNAYEDLQTRAEQLQTANDLLQAKQHELEQANNDLRMQEQDLRNHAEALQASQERLALAASGTRIGMYDWDIATGETLWTEQVARLLGLRTTTATTTTTTTTTTVSQLYHYQDWAERVHPEDLPRAEAELRRCLAERAPYEAEYRVVWPDGCVHWLADRGVLQYESEGRCTRMLGILMDITERRRAEEALRDNQALVHALMDGSPDLIYVKDLDGHVLMANPAACEALGRPAKDVIDKSAREFHRDDPEVGRAILENDRRIMESGQTETVEELGSEGRTYLSTKAPYRDAAGNVIGLLGISHDITDRKRAEEALRQALRDTQRRYAEISALMTCTRAVLECRDFLSAARTVFDACRELLGAPAGYVAVLTPDGEDHQVLFLEPGGLSCTVDPARPMPVRGLRGEAYRAGRVVYENDFARSPWANLLPPGHARLENALFAPLVLDGRTIGVLGLGNKAGGFTDRDAPLAATFGELIAIALRNSRTLDSLRELNATLETKVTQRTAELEYRARQLQKLTLELSQAEDRERRRIAAILHEDLQQQIAGAKFHLTLARNRARHDPPQQAIVDRVDEMLKEAIRKSRRLSHDLSPAVLHLNDLQEVLQWLAHRVQEQQGLTVRLDVPSAATLRSEALTMFLFRAAQEMLFNVVKHAGVNEAALRVRHRGRYVGLRISDRGRGFDPQDLRKTAGFGLLSIRERVELLGGRMKMKTAPGRGSTFSIVLPDGAEEGEGPQTHSLAFGNPE